MADQKDNVIPLRPNYALFNQNIRQNLANSLVGVVPAEQETKTVDRFEEILCAEIMKFFRATIVKIASRAGESLGKKIVGP